MIKIDARLFAKGKTNDKDPERKVVYPHLMSFVL